MADQKSHYPTIHNTKQQRYASPRPKVHSPPDKGRRANRQPCAAPRSQHRSAQAALHFLLRKSACEIIVEERDRLSQR